MHTCKPGECKCHPNKQDKDLERVSYELEKLIRKIETMNQLKGLTKKVRTK